jgi:NADH-quinone oxidoreductase subunit K
MIILITNFLFVGFSLFFIGVFGFLCNRKNILLLLLSLELMLLSVNFNFVFLSVYIDDLFGQIFTLIVLTIAAAESALGLAILISYYRVRGGITLDSVQLLRS